MDSSRNTSTPASTRVVDLVRQHHGLPQHADVGLPEENGGNWRKQARSRHLHARRRQVNLSEIPESQYPVVLEIHGCSHFVILTAKRDDDTYCVQFPDSREADVSAERLEEFYDGHCVFLKPMRSVRHDDEEGGSGAARRSFREFLATAKLSKGAFGFNLVVLLLTWLLIYSNNQALGELVHRSLILPLLATGVAAPALAGVIGLRHELFRHRIAAGWMDLAFVPVLFGTAMAFAGWAVVPLLGFAALLVVGLLSSKKLGTVQSSLQRHWKAVVAVAFLIGAFSLSFSYLDGALNVAMMNGALGLSTYAVYLIAHGGNSWQSMRLAMCS
jgi:hypothetical protein